MKEIAGFMRWGWRNLQFWQKMFIFAMFLQAAGWTLGGEWGPRLVMIGAAIVLGYIFKWAVIESVQTSWANYKKHRNELLTTIKESDER